MGSSQRRIPGVIWDKMCGVWSVDKIIGGKRIRRRFGSDIAEAQSWLVAEIANFNNARRNEPQLQKRTFSEAAIHYVKKNEKMRGIESDIYMLKSVMPFIADIYIDEIFTETLDPFVNNRREAGMKGKTINNGLEIVQRILNRCADEYRDGKQRWLEHPPVIKRVSQHDSRKPYPISWDEQSRLMQHLPEHLANMATFAINTGARDNVICNLLWRWEIPLGDEAGNTVFVVPAEFVKQATGEMEDRIVIVNSIAKEVIDSVRGQHPDYVFVYRRGKNIASADGHPFQVSHCDAVQTMNNTAWQRSRRLADLSDLHVHDLRHTLGERLRAAGVNEATCADLLWHKRPGMTAHYTKARMLLLQEAAELVTNPANCENKSAQSIIYEARSKWVKLDAKSPNSHPEIKRARGNIPLTL